MIPQVGFWGRKKNTNNRIVKISKVITIVIKLEKQDNANIIMKIIPGKRADCFYPITKMGQGSQQTSVSSDEPGYL